MYILIYDIRIVLLLLHNKVVNLDDQLSTKIKTFADTEKKVNQTDCKTRARILFLTDLRQLFLDNA